MKIEDCKIGMRVKTAVLGDGSDWYTPGVTGTINRIDDNGYTWFTPDDPSLDKYGYKYVCLRPEHLEPQVTQVVLESTTYDTDVSIEHLGYKARINGSMLVLFDRDFNYIEVAVEDIGAFIDTIITVKASYNHMKGIPCEE